jgi:hypothetical protein
VYMEGIFGKKRAPTFLFFVLVGWLILPLLTSYHHGRKTKWTTGDILLCPPFLRYVLTSDRPVL